MLNWRLAREVALLGMRYRRRRPRPKQFLLRPKMNEYIRVPEVRVIDEDGKNLDVMETAKAIALARERGLDLVEISAKAVPPVARIMERGKFMYEMEKKERKARKGLKTDESKATRLRLATSPHDMEMKAEQVDNFLKKGYKVQIELVLQGREKALGQMAWKKMEDFLKLLAVEHHVTQELKRGPRGVQITIGR